MTKQHKKDQIPENVSREELAKFWDTHDFTDYLTELKPAKECTTLPDKPPTLPNHLAALACASV